MPFIKRDRLMRIFFDTEFIEYPPYYKGWNNYGKGTIDLISIGLVREDGEEYYAISSDFEEELASEWVIENVIEKLEPDIKRKNNRVIQREVYQFVHWNKVHESENPEFYAYFCNYDWVVFCWLFGTMMELPKGFPMYCHDIKQIMDMLSIPREDLPEQGDGHHNALADAKWNKKAFEYILSKKDDRLMTNGLHL